MADQGILLEILQDTGELGLSVKVQRSDDQVPQSSEQKVV